MRQYKIWNNIQSCLYKNTGGKTGNKSYGVNDHSTKYMNVGTSSKNSHLFAEITQTCRELDNGDLSFRLYVDGEVIKEGIVSKKDKTLEITNNLLFKHNVINEGVDLAEFAKGNVKVIYPE
jgi:hypothetical protein